jgi:uncharacterized protein YjdB/murein DD-endopeptidase MepM/ murein hydrolase activator NlpD
MNCIAQRPWTIACRGLAGLLCLFVMACSDGTTPSGPDRSGPQDGATATISSSGGIVELPGYGSVTFPPNAFTASQTVGVTAASNPDAQQTFRETIGDFLGGPNAMHQVRITTGHRLPATTIDVRLVVPATLLSSLQGHINLQVFAQVYQQSAQDILDMFEPLTSVFDPASKTIQAQLPAAAFTGMRQADGTVEAVLIIGSRPPAAENTLSGRGVVQNSAMQHASPAACPSGIGMLAPPMKRSLVVTQPFNPPAHRGLDLKAENGTDVVSMAEGVIERDPYYQISNNLNQFGQRMGWGWNVQVRHADGSITVYAHLDGTVEGTLKKGQPVRQGQFLAKSDNSGGSTGPHLHVDYFDRDGNRLNPDGCIDRVASLSVVPASASIEVGGVQQFAAIVTGTTGRVFNSDIVEWSSNEPAVASVVASNGLVTGAKEGNATITATTGGKSGTAAVAVTASVSRVEITPATAEVNVGSNVTLSARAYAADGTELTGRTFTWTSDQPTIATVTNGVVTGVNEGNATITAMTGGKSGTAAVAVTASVSRVEITPATAEVNVGSNVTLSARAYAADGTELTGRTFEWASDQPGIASVANGVVMGVKEGTATITATTGGKSGTAAVAVTASVSRVEITPATAEVNVGSNVTLSARAYAADGTELTGRTFEWASDQPGIASVANGVVTGVKEGTATITATTGGKSGTATITVFDDVSGTWVGTYAAESWRTTPGLPPGYPNLPGLPPGRAPMSLQLSEFVSPSGQREVRGRVEQWAGFAEVTGTASGNSITLTYICGSGNYCLGAPIVATVSGSKMTGSIAATSTSSAVEFELTRQ